MKHEKTPKGKSGGWKPTKTPNKRAAAITRRLAFLEALHGATKDGWARVSLKELGRSYQTNSSPTYLIDHGILARKHRKYIWLGPKPTKEMAEALCDYRMTYERYKKDRDTPLRPDISTTLKALRTQDRKVEILEVGLQWCYGKLHRGYKRVRISSEIVKRGVPRQAIGHLLNKGCLERPRQGVYKWIGPEPDRELALWLNNELAEQHRANYRSRRIKDEQAKVSNEMIGKTTSLNPESPKPCPASPEQNGPEQAVQAYWTTTTTTW